MKEVVLDIRCQGCGELTTPSTIDMDLFRIGVHVHPNAYCYKLVEDKLRRKEVSPHPIT